ncbi:transposase [Burkholderia sp. Bp8998]|nr:transposase [Burkholderia sp. Bp8998]
MRMLIDNMSQSESSLCERRGQDISATGHRRRRSGVVVGAVTDDLWRALAPMLPVVTISPRGGRPRLDDRAALNGILFVLRTGIPWEDLPQEFGFGSGMTCWRRLRDWHENGVWERVWPSLAGHDRAYEKIDWRRAVACAATAGSPWSGKRSRRGRRASTEQSV